MPIRIAKNEEAVYLSVERGVFDIDDEGRVWRLIMRGAPCSPRRAEHLNSYLKVTDWIDRRTVTAMAHRLVWRHFNGPIPDGLVINHINGVKGDNRPENLEALTYQENHAHAALSQLMPSGERSGSSRLKDCDVYEIRERYRRGETQARIAADFGMSLSAIRCIVHRRTWKHLPPILIEYHPRHHPPAAQQETT